MTKKKLKFNTRVIHEGQIPEEPFGAVSLPIYQTSTFKQNEFGEYIFDYSRADNPTRKNLEKNIASLEGGIGSVAFSSGMAAISSICQLFKSGDEFIFTNNVYGGTYRLCTKIFQRFGVEFSFVSSASPETVEMAQCYWYLDPKRAGQDLGFSPRAPMETLRETIDDIRERKTTP